MLDQLRELAETTGMIIRINLVLGVSFLLLGAVFILSELFSNPNVNNNEEE